MVVNEMMEVEDMMIQINIDKNKLIQDLLSLINGPDRCSICAFKEQQKWNDSKMPICNMCVNEDYWELSESVLATIIESSLTVMDTTVETETGACSKKD